MSTRELTKVDIAGAVGGPSTPQKRAPAGALEVAPSAAVLGGRYAE